VDRTAVIRETMLRYYYEIESPVCFFTDPNRNGFKAPEEAYYAVVLRLFCVPDTSNLIIPSGLHGLRANRRNSRGDFYIILPLRLLPLSQPRLQTLYSFPIHSRHNGSVPFLRHPCPCQHGSRLSSRIENGEQFKEEGYSDLLR
jgi:hypothetical protein